MFSSVGFVSLVPGAADPAPHSAPNPQRFHPGPWSLTLDTAPSFVSDASWQFDGGETTLSYLSQMAGITVASFPSAAVGVSVAIALARGLASRGGESLGNFRAGPHPLPLLRAAPDLTRRRHRARFAGRDPEPLALRHGAHPHRRHPDDRDRAVASQEAIKLLSGDGGGFFNTNSAHPFENPTAVSNLVEMLLMLLVPAALTATFGR